MMPISLRPRPRSVLSAHCWLSSAPRSPYRRGRAPRAGGGETGGTGRRGRAGSREAPSGPARFAGGSRSPSTPAPPWPRQLSGGHLSARDRSTSAVPGEEPEAEGQGAWLMRRQQPWDPGHISRWPAGSRVGEAVRGRTFQWTTQLGDRPFLDQQADVDGACQRMRRSAGQGLPQSPNEQQKVETQVVEE